MRCLIARIAGCSSHRRGGDSHALTRDPELENLLHSFDGSKQAAEGADQAGGVSHIEIAPLRDDCL